MKTASFIVTAACCLGPALASAQTPAPPPAPKPADTTHKPKPAPFAFGDFTWLNGNSRQATSVLDSKYFTGEFRA